MPVLRSRHAAALVPVVVTAALAASLTAPSASAFDTDGTTVPPDTQVTFLAELPHRESALAAAALSISSPESARFRSYLTVDEAAREFGASDRQIDDLKKAASRLGLRVNVDATRLLARITGPVSAWEAAMGTAIKATPGSTTMTYSFPADAAAVKASLTNPSFWDVHATSDVIEPATLGAPKGLSRVVTRMVAAYQVMTTYAPNDVPPGTTGSPGTATGMATDANGSRSLYYPGSTKLTPPTNPAWKSMDSCVTRPGAPLGTDSVVGQLMPENFLGHSQVFTAYGLEGLNNLRPSALNGRVAIISLHEGGGNLAGGISGSDLVTAAQCFGFVKPRVQFTLGTGVHEPITAPGAEPTLDIQTVGAVLATGASIRLVQGTQPTVTVGLADTVSRALTASPRPYAISASYGACEPTTALRGLGPTVDSLFQFAAVVGTTITASSGDGGSAVCQNNAAQQVSIARSTLNTVLNNPAVTSTPGFDEQQFIDSITQLPAFVEASAQAAYPTPTVAFPASSPFVTSVGGTTMNLDPRGTLVGESVWNDVSYVGGSAGNNVGTGGPSAVYRAPAYQRPLTSSAMRSVPDVSALAGRYPALPMVLEGEITLTDGTSQASPLTAAALAILSAREVAQGRPTLGFVNPWLYHVASTHPAAMHDVTVGDNQYPIAYQVVGDAMNIPACCQATPGYDMASGLGVPHYSILKNHTQVEVRTTGR